MYLIYISIITLILILYMIFSKDNYTLDSIFLISLKKDEERRNNVLSNIDVNYIYSYNGEKINRENLIRDGLLDNNVERELTKGELGCYFSHLHIITKAVRHKKVLLILEDDIYINEEKLKEIKKVLKEAPKDFQILSLGYNYYENYDYERIGVLYGLQCYIVNGKNININEIKKLFPIKVPIDFAIPKVFKTYIVEPKICELKDYNDGSNTQGIN
jgi:hypothetical protein